MTTLSLTPDLPPDVLPSPDTPPAPDGTCRAGVGWQYRPDDVPMEPTEDEPFHLRYRSRCSGCGHTGPARSRENRAAEDACDHAYPGWRDMPVMEYRPYEGKKARARWEAAARAVYPEGWFERGGPVREYRTGCGMRHVPKYAPGGGYCMAVARPKRMPAPDPAAAPARGVQESLFG
ncbi:DUF6349 family protein [Microtetraspora malaysiensis]|uniref:DUF6349 family protein n=1 Tax=Microtetraspora malaysiensis TaxID=161358 RepID=A0ABW6SKL5_9ACTN